MNIFGRLMLALTVAGSVVVAAALVAQRKERRLAGEQLQRELEVWEDETGSFGGAETPAVA